MNHAPLLSRRALRVKVMQALYAHQQDHDADAAFLEKDLFRRIRDTGRTLRYQFVFLVEVADRVLREAETRAAKYLPTDEDRDFSRRFYHNALVAGLRADADFRRDVERDQLTGLVDGEIVRLAYQALKASPAYAAYLAEPADADGRPSPEAERAVVLAAFNEVFWPSEDVQQHLEDIFPNWDDDVDLVIPRTRQLVQAWEPGTPLDATGLDGSLPAEGRDFARQLLHATLEHADALDDLVVPRLENWELDRVSLMDRVLLRMALCELLYFDTVPVKVSINEYIDISKSYSTPRSKDFINGVLDNILQQLRQEGRIRKRGRGLVE